MFKILVVEDDKDLNKTVCSFLNHSGYEAIGCLNANDAYDILTDNVIDLIVSDVMMPGIDGFEFAASVREVNQDIPILFMTAKDDIASKQRGFRIGVDDYMVKPIDFDELFLRIGALLRRAKIASNRKLEIGNFVMDADEHTAYLNEEEITFLVSCSTILFVTILRDTLNLQLTVGNVNMAAKLTFGNVIFLSILFTLIDYVRRKFTTEKITKHIAQAAQKVVEGDFSVRIEPVNRLSADENLNEIIHCFNTMAAELGSVETLRTDFIANVSHEMKTPLSVMQNYGKLLQMPGLSEEKRMEYAKGIAEGSHRLADMMTNILKLNKLEKQQIYPKTEEYDLGEQLCECLLRFENVWEEKNIEIETEITEDVKVNTDQELLSLVWNNLFSNAFKFTPENGKVTLILETTEEYATVKVKDTGCGMSQEVGKHIFEKFYQGDTSHATQGNGLGLALVKRVVDILQGEICVESVPGKGSTFIVRFRKL